MPTYTYYYRDRSAEYSHWYKHYRDLGCSEMKVLKLVFRRMARS